MLHEIKSLRSDCSTGHDQIPVKFIKLVAEEIASPLTHIINCCIEKEYFPLQWKIARIFPIPKTNYPTTNNDLRGISILLALSKIYEKLVLRQMVQFIDSEHLLPSHVSAIVCKIKWATMISWAVSPFPPIQCWNFRLKFNPKP